MIHWIFDHKEVVGGAIGGSVTLLLDAVKDFSDSSAWHIIAYDSHVLFMAILLILLKAAFGALVGAWVGKRMTKPTKTDSGDTNYPDPQGKDI